MMAIIFDDFTEVLGSVLRDGMTIMAGGFGLCGIPENAIKVIADLKVKDLTIISNNCGVDEFGLGLLLKNGQIKKMISSYVGENNMLADQYIKGQIEIEWVPQGTLAEKIRASGAGIPAFYTQTGLGTQIAEGKEHKVFNGKEYILEPSLTADISIIKGYKADRFGNVVYNKTAQNFNADMVRAGHVTFVEVEEILDEPLPPDAIHTPSIYVNYLMKGKFEKRIERKVVND